MKKLLTYPRSSDIILVLKEAEPAALTLVAQAAGLILIMPMLWVCLCRAETVSVRIFLWGYPNIATKDMMINDDIHAKEVRVVGEDGEQLGIMSVDAAKDAAFDAGLDLVMIAPQAVPPVCKIMDYGKFRFERDKKEKEAKKKQQTVELKEIQLSCRIDTHDFETKVKHAIRFLGDGNKVRVVMRFKGREMAHIPLGREIIEKFEAACSEVGTADKKPVLDGRFLSMVLAPIKNK